MSNKLFRVKLTQDERDQLQQITKGKRGLLKIAAWKVQRAQALLLADENEGEPTWTDQAIAEAVRVSVRSIENWRKQAVLQGPLSLMERKPMPAKGRKLDGEGEAHLVKLACSSPPPGYSQWSLRLMAEELVSLEIVDSISHETVRSTLKKTS